MMKALCTVDVSRQQPPSATCRLASSQWRIDPALEAHLGHYYSLKARPADQLVPDSWAVSWQRPHETDGRRLSDRRNAGYLQLALELDALPMDQLAAMGVTSGEFTGPATLNYSVPVHLCRFDVLGGYPSIRAELENALALLSSAASTTMRDTAIRSADAEVQCGPRHDRAVLAQAAEMTGIPLTYSGVSCVPRRGLLFLRAVCAGSH